MATRKVPLEVEAKLLAPQPSALQALAALRQIGPYRLQPRRAARLYSEYLDTPELSLARRGMALRLRRHGRRWEATLKWEGKTGRLIHERPEINVPLPRRPPIPFPIPAGPIHRRLGRQVTGKPLRPILVTLIHRRRFDVLPPAHADLAEPVAELALDTVQLLAAPRGRRHTARPPKQGGLAFCEVEIELLRGTRRDLTYLATILQRDFGLTPSRQSKFARGLAMLYPDLPRKRKRRTSSGIERAARPR